MNPMTKHDERLFLIGCITEAMNEMVSVEDVRKVHDFVSDMVYERA